MTTPTIPPSIADAIDALMTVSAVLGGSQDNSVGAIRVMLGHEATARAALEKEIAALVAERDTLRKAVTAIDDAFDVLEKTGNPVELRGAIDAALIGEDRAERPERGQPWVTP